jgi:hypothetical protein
MQTFKSGRTNIDEAHSGWLLLLLMQCVLPPYLEQDFGGKGGVAMKFPE